MNNKKETGSYYTPSWLSDFIVEYLTKNITLKSKINILEPSCWDWVFIKSILKSKLNNSIDEITLADINEDALNIASSFSWSKKTIKFLWDFLKLNIWKKFNLIIWNPPYIHKKYLSEEQKESCHEWYKYAWFGKKRVQNIWPSFIYKSEYLLKEDWIMIFVIPEELVRVNYAKDTLEFLQEKFERLEIFSLDKVIFWDAWQNTIVIFAYKNHDNQWTFSWQIKVKWINREKFEYDSLKLSKKNFELLSQKELWTELWANDIDFINKINSKFKIISDFSKSQTWIVTWANDFFIISKENKEKYKLDNFTLPIIRKWYYIKNNLKFSQKDFLKIEQENKPCYLLTIKWEAIDKKLLDYLKIWEEQKINKRYKVNTYKPNWYNTPNIWGAKLLFFKRSHIAPKLIFNPEMINITDSWYRITLNEDWYEKEFQYCFYNSFTLLMMELWWRTYWWWVLEVTPNEFKKLPIPFYKDIKKDELNRFYKQDLNNIDKIISNNDKYLLKERFWLSDYELSRIDKIRKILLNKRLNKKA